MMGDIYVLLIFSLFVLAIADLVVGVSNDAVNFLNSAVGSKAISFRFIMILASLGVFVGALFSSGLMEVARKGIFVPEKFYFDEIVVIFMAVMITDVLLLDFFNTMGLPTSTTVSLVFGLLGAAISTAVIKMVSQGESISGLGSYINTTKAGEIIFGIVFSVFMAFICGSVIQFISRFFLSFKFENKSVFANALFGGISITAITYFLIITGVKDLSFISTENNIWIQSHQIEIIFGTLILWTVFSAFFVGFLKKSIYKFIIAMGTFSLAMAFAGNDLVNFIGVPVAAWQSFEAWSHSGIEATSFSMGILENKVVTPTPILLFSGCIMVLTLWFSRKAKNVAKTEMNLSDQNNEKEHFEPNLLSRSLVRFVLWFWSLVKILMPQRFMENLNQRFARPMIDYSKGKPVDLPAFDMVRGATNLTVSSILIALGTSLKLPLSTTYVTFMVAMGSSFADRAWGTDSAVYRIAGVFRVIGGWFLTAIIAALSAGILAYLIHLGGATTISILLILTISVFVRNYLRHRAKIKAKMPEDTLSESESRSVLGVMKESLNTISKVFARSEKIYEANMQGLASQNLAILKKNKKQIEKLTNEIEELRNSIFYFIKRLEDSAVEASSFYITLLGTLEDLTQTLGKIAKKSLKHIENNHKSLTFKQINELSEIQAQIKNLFKDIREAFKEGNFTLIQVIAKQNKHISDNIAQKIEMQIKRTKTDEAANPKSTILYFTLLTETKSFMDYALKILELYHKENKKLI